VFSNYELYSFETRTAEVQTKRQMCSNTGVRRQSSKYPYCIENVSSRCIALRLVVLRVALANDAWIFEGWCASSHAGKWLALQGVLFLWGIATDVLLSAILWHLLPFGAPFHDQISATAVMWHFWGPWARKATSPVPMPRQQQCVAGRAE